MASGSLPRLAQRLVLGLLAIDVVLGVVLLLSLFGGNSDYWALYAVVACVCLTGGAIIAAVALATLGAHRAPKRGLLAAGLAYVSGAFAAAGSLAEFDHEGLWQLSGYALTFSAGCFISALLTARTVAPQWRWIEVLANLGVVVAMVQVATFIAGTDTSPDLSTWFTPVLLVTAALIATHFAIAFLLPFDAPGSRRLGWIATTAAVLSLAGLPILADGEITTFDRALLVQLGIAVLAALGFSASWIAFSRRTLWPLPAISIGAVGVSLVFYSVVAWVEFYGNFPSSNGLDYFALLLIIWTALAVLLCGMWAVRCTPNDTWMRMLATTGFTLLALYATTAILTEEAGPVSLWIVMSIIAIVSGPAAIAFLIVAQMRRREAAATVDTGEPAAATQEPGRVYPVT